MWKRLARLGSQDEQENFAQVPGGALQIHVDGSYDPRSDRGGWGFVVHEGHDEIMSACGSIQGGDNSTAELTALLQALEWIAAHAADQTITIWSDSRYVVNGCNSWRHVWRTSDWRRRGSGGKGRRRPVPCTDLWRPVDRHLAGMDGIEIAWCKSHGVIEGNIKADALATRGRLSPCGPRPAA